MFDPSNIGANFGGPGMSQNPWHWFRENKTNRDFLFYCAYDLYYRKLTYEMYECFDDKTIALRFLSVPWYVTHDELVVSHYYDSKILINASDCLAFATLPSGTHILKIPENAPSGTIYIATNEFINIGVLSEVIECYRKARFEDCHDCLMKTVDEL